MNKLITTYNGGMPIVLDDVRWNDDAYRAAFNGILKAFGTDFIVQGCVYSAIDDSVTAGYIMLNGELLQVDAHTKTGAGYYQKVTTYNAAGTKTFRNASINDTYQQNRGLATAASGTLLYNGIRLEDIIVFFDQIGYQANLIPKIGPVDLGASLPIATDVSKNIATLSASDFRTLIDVSDSLTVDNIVSSKLSTSWTTFSLIRNTTNFTLNSSFVNFLKIGKIVFIEFYVDFTVNTSTGNLIEVKESGTTYSSLIPYSGIWEAASVENPTHSIQTGRIMIIDASLGATGFFLRIVKSDNTNFETGQFYASYKGVYHTA